MATEPSFNRKVISKNEKIDRYHIKEKEAQALADFLLPMLEWYPEKRATAAQMLSHPWLYMKGEKNIKMSEKEYRQMTLKQKLAGINDSDLKININTAAGGVGGGNGEHTKGRANSTLDGCNSNILGLNNDVLNEHMSELCSSESEIMCADIEDNCSDQSEQNDSDTFYSSPLNKYGPNSHLLNIDHGCNPQFKILNFDEL